MFGPDPKFLGWPDLLLAVTHSFMFWNHWTHIKTYALLTVLSTWTCCIITFISTCIKNLMLILCSNNLIIIHVFNKTNHCKKSTVTTKQNESQQTFDTKLLK
jgi:hypothetical protein